MPLPEMVELPLKLCIGTYVVSSSAPELVTLELHYSPEVRVSSPEGDTTRLPAAEASIVALLNGIPAPEPTTIGLTTFDLANGKTVIVCTEVAENEGRSVTNSWPDLAPAVLQHLGGAVRRERAVFVEHYCTGSYRNSDIEETFDEVVLAWSGDKPVGHSWARIEMRPAKK